MNNNHMNKPLTFLLALIFPFFNRRESMRTIAFAVLFSILSASSGYAGDDPNSIKEQDNNYYPFSGIDLMTACNSINPVEINTCNTLIAGIHHSRIYVTNDHPLYSFCTSRTIRLNQLRLVVGKWLKDNPQELHKDGFYLVLSALREGFPCE